MECLYLKIKIQILISKKPYTIEDEIKDAAIFGIFVEEGRLENLEDIRSLLMACQYDAKFAF